MPRLRHRGVWAWLLRQWRAFALAVRQVVKLEDSPERIARGCAAGVLCAYLPMVGQTLVGMLVAWLIRGSVLASMPWSWISNPLTTLPLWYGCYRLGAALLPNHRTITWEGLASMVRHLEEMSFLAGLAYGVQMLGDVLVPMLVGSLIVGLATALPTWWLVRRTVVAVQARRAARTAHWRGALAGRVAAATIEPPPAKDV